ncbi:MAG: hypothetical protein JWP93_2338 [Polaromonas sp.]|nr:hypothetical protein [Polaromonas sp.]
MTKSNPIPSDAADDEIDLWPVIHHLVSAADAPPLKLTGPVSVFCLADAAIEWGFQELPQLRQMGYRIERSPGVLRYTPLPLHETAEWKEREAARRARQIVPRPGAKVKASMNAMKSPLRILTEFRAMA